jgi:thioredoxin-related protein
MKKLILLLSLITLSFANKDSNFTIFNSYKDALKVAKEEKKPLFILFTKENCRWCKKLKSDLLENSNLKDRLQKEFIVLFLDKNIDKFPKSYNINGVPSVFLVSEDEDIYTEIIGYHKDPKDYIKWFNYVKIERED